MFVVEDGKAIKRLVKTGYGESGMIEVSDGLNEYDDVITVGQIGLKTDAAVTVINKPPEDSVPEEDVEPAESVADGSE